MSSPTHGILVTMNQRKKNFEQRKRNVLGMCYLASTPSKALLPISHSLPFCPGSEGRLSNDIVFCFHFISIHTHRRHFHWNAARWIFTHVCNVQAPRGSCHASAKWMAAPYGVSVTESQAENNWHPPSLNWFAKPFKFCCDLGFHICAPSIYAPYVDAGPDLCLTKFGMQVNA